MRGIGASDPPGTLNTRLNLIRSSFVLANLDAAPQAVGSRMILEPACNRKWGRRRRARRRGSGAGWRRTNYEGGFVLAVRVDAPGVRELGMGGSIG